MGIDPADIDDLFQNPDRFENIEFKGLGLTFVLRKFPQFPRAYYLLGYGERKGKGMNISMAWKLYPWGNLDLDALKPVKLLEHFASDFGLPIKIGSITKPFYFQETVQVEDQYLAEPVKILNPDNHEFVQQIFTRFEQSDNMVSVDCALGLCIDMFEYRTALNP